MCRRQWGVHGALLPELRRDRRSGGLSMDLQGSTYLYSLAGISITFVGFSTLVVVLRQTFGGTMSNIDIFITRVFIQLSFIVAASAIVPNLLSLFALPQPVIWRISSVVAAIPSFLFGATYPMRRRAASGVRTPIGVWLDISILLIAATILIANAIGIGFEPGPGPFAVGLTIILFVSGWAYLQALDVLLRQHLTRRQSDHDSSPER
jgi:hypothetical protein